MKRVRRTSALVLALGLAGALAACGEDPSEETASPGPTATSTAPSTPPTTDAAAATTPAPPAETTPVLGPDGIGALTLGMDRDQAVASGAVAPFAMEPGSGCMAHTALSSAPADEGLVYVSSNLGVAAIEAYPGVSTPEGIAIGSPVAEVDQAYPDWDPSEDLMRGWAPVPGNDEAYYRIAFDDDREVSELTLQFVDQDCYE